MKTTETNKIEFTGIYSIVLKTYGIYHVCKNYNEAHDYLIYEHEDNLYRWKVEIEYADGQKIKMDGEEFMAEFL